jgi:hypothetical protein
MNYDYNEINENIKLKDEFQKINYGIIKDEYDPLMYYNYNELNVFDINEYLA